MTIAANLGAFRMDGSRRRRWEIQRDSGIVGIPSNDCATCDPVLETARMVGAVRDGEPGALTRAPWFDTRDQYVVPQLTRDALALDVSKPVAEYREALALGIDTRPVLLGPISFLLLATMGDAPRLEILDQVMAIYAEAISRLAREGATWVQLDEPMLVTDISPDAQAAYGWAYAVLAGMPGAPKLLVATYFGGLGDNIALAALFPVAGLHVDLVRAPEQLDGILRALPHDRVLSAGVIDGRTVWRTDIEGAYRTLERIAYTRGTERLWVAPSCSLRYVPAEMSGPWRFDAEVRTWLTFGQEKLTEVAVLARAVDTGDLSAPEFDAGRRAAAAQRIAPAAFHEIIANLGVE